MSLSRALNIDSYLVQMCSLKCRTTVSVPPFPFRKFVYLMSCSCKRRHKQPKINHYRLNLTCRQLLMVSFGGMGICMLGMALGMASPQLAALSGTIALLGTIGYILAFACGTGPVPGLLVPEMTSARVRGRAVALAMGTHWVCNFIIGQAFLPTVALIGVAGVYTFFSAICAMAVAFIGKYVIETKGKSPEVIEKAMATL